MTLREWALIGAKQRLHELQEEMNAITGVFPELGAEPTSRTGLLAPHTETDDTTKRGGYKWTAEQRAAAATRMRRRWRAMKTTSSRSDS